MPLCLCLQLLRPFNPPNQLPYISSPYELIFAVQVGALGFATYFLQQGTSMPERTMTSDNHEPLVHKTKDSPANEIERDNVLIQNKVKRSILMRFEDVSP